METKKSAAIAVKIALGLILAAGLALRLWYGSFGLRLNRFEDEQHSWPNIQAVLETGTLAPLKTYYPYPLFNLPPAATIAGGERLSGSMSDEPWTALTADGKVSPGALLLCRLWPIFYGTLAIWLTFLIGRRVFSDPTGLIGALLLAFSPQAIHSSGYFKPDSQLLSMTLLALLLALRAVERPTLVRYVLAGLGVTLAASSKAIGVLTAVPLVVASLITARRRHRDLLLLGAAGVSSVVSFLLMNPYWRVYPKWLANIRYHYSIQAKLTGQTQLSVPRRTLEFLLEPTVQSSLLSALGLLGFLGLIVWLWRNRQIDTPWLDRLMFVFFPVTYVTVYALTTAYFKGNNFLVLLPFLFLATGWMSASIWSRATEASQILRRPVPALLAAIIFVLVAASPGVTYTYSRLVPPTHLLAKEFLAGRLEPPEGRLVYMEDPRIARPNWEGWPRQFARDRAAFKTVASAHEIPAAALALSDGLAVDSAALEEAGAEELGRWLASLPPEQVRTFEPELFQARGRRITAAHQMIPPLRAPEPLPLERCPGRADCLTAELPGDLRNGEIDSLIVYVGQSHFDRNGELPAFRLGGHRVDLAWASWIREANQHHFISSRVDLHGAEPRLVIEATAGERLRPAEFTVALCRWMRPETP